MIDPRVIEANESLTHQTGDIAAFGAIAERTTKGKVVLLALPAMLLTNDVVHLKGMHAVAF
ncbi:MAG TPA: hypothetical protein VGO11_16935 [Chthoniobacteraceae bacterium]|jgi:hypothetical protein|nr:hypothetical protein [Chthoniobacteraceae bacterium]